MFQVLKDNGERWNMTYRKSGVDWERVADSSGFEQSGTAGLAGPTPGLPPMIGGSPLGAILEIGHIASNVALVLETRQQRLLEEAAREESRRIPWLVDMIELWGDVHRDGNCLDLRVSEFLAREARATMDSLVANKRIGVPQSIMYELDVIRDTFGSFRLLLLTQFEAAAQSDAIDLQRAVRRVLPGSSLNLDFIRTLARDPAVEWGGRVKTRSSNGFDGELAESFRHSEIFMSKLFPSTEVAIMEPVEAPKHPGLLERLIGLIALNLPSPRPEDFKADPAERRDVFREFVLLPAEIARVKALHTAWLATNAIVLEASGAELDVQVSHAGIAVEPGINRPSQQLSSRETVEIQ